MPFELSGLLLIGGEMGWGNRYPPFGLRALIA
jgi:hypothetical protein